MSILLQTQIHLTQVSSRSGPLIIVLRIGRTLRSCIATDTPFTMHQLLQQAEIWFNRIVAIQEKIPRNLPPSNKYIGGKDGKDGAYTLWKWDRKCDATYACAIWELGMNQKVRVGRQFIMIANSR
jgi:hypothetical protein